MAGGDERQGGRIPVLSGFRPQFWPTVVAIPAVLVLLGLGVWQVERLHWKEGLIAQRQAALAAAPVAPPRSAEAARGLDFHPVIAEGVFWHDKEIFLHATAESGRVGYHVYTPLMTDDGRVIFVNRGFIPTELRDPATRAAGQVAGQVRVQGLLRLPPAGRPGWLLPDNDPRQNHWFWVDLPAMAAADGLDNAAAFAIDADTTPNPGGWPKGGVSRANLPNDHLQYALTWFSLAVALIVIYVLSQRGDSGRA
jgi:surfeit locus 1 family protein